MRCSIDVPRLFADARLFDVILIDPPYAEATRAASRLARLGGWLARDGVLVFEHARRHPAPETAGPLIRTRDLVSGDTALAFFRHRPADAGSPAGSVLPGEAASGRPRDDR